MRHEVTLSFGPGREVAIPVHADDAIAADAARRWLDDEFVANDCEPLRPSGKVLTADKVLALAGAVGPVRFESDASYRRAFALAVVSALGKPLVRVDVEAGAVTC